MSWNWLIAGGDRRALRLAEKLKQNGWQVQTLGLSEGDEQTVRPEQADAILLPYPWSARGGLIPTLMGLTLHPENVLRQASPGTLVLAGGGLEDTPAMNEVRRRELRVRRYQDAPGFAERNAAISAEGAVFHAMGETDAMLEGLPVMVLGYGLFGRETARRLKALGARVTVLARREEVRQLARSDGMRACPFEAFIGFAGETKLLLNTVPARLLNRERLSALPKDCVLLELASTPGGFDPRWPEAWACGREICPGCPENTPRTRRRTRWKRPAATFSDRKRRDGRDEKDHRWLCHDGLLLYLREKSGPDGRTGPAWLRSAAHLVL